MPLEGQLYAGGKGMDLVQKTAVSWEKKECSKKRRSEWRQLKNIVNEQKERDRVTDSEMLYRRITYFLRWKRW